MSERPSIVVKGGTVVDQEGERLADVVVVDGQVTAVGADLSADLTLDASGCLVMPGLVDIHSHLREPGREEAETVETGARSSHRWPRWPPSASGCSPTTAPGCRTTS